MLIEFYGVPGALALGEKYEEPFLSLLIGQTAELRRDPDKRERENATKSLNKFLAEQKEKHGDTLKTKTKDGREIEIDLSGFTPV